MVTDFNAQMIENFPELLTKYRYPRLWLVDALTQYCFNNKRAGKLKKAREARKKLGAQSRAASRSPPPVGPPTSPVDEDDSAGDDDTTEEGEGTQGEDTMETFKQLLRTNPAFARKLMRKTAKAGAVPLLSSHSLIYSLRFVAKKRNSTSKMSISETNPSERKSPAARATRSAVRPRVDDSDDVVSPFLSISQVLTPLFQEISEFDDEPVAPAKKRAKRN